MGPRILPTGLLGTASIVILGAGCVGAITDLEGDRTGTGSTLSDHPSAAAGTTARAAASGDPVRAGTAAPEPGPLTAPTPFDGRVPDRDECMGVRRDPGPALSRRLTADEYLRTVGQTLGLEPEALAGQLPPDSKAEGFTNTASALTVTFGHVQRYQQLAEEAASRIPARDAFVARHSSCTRFEAACQRSFIEGLGRVLFRRPLDDPETARFEPIYAQVQRDGGSFAAASTYVLEAMLQSPPFLYRLERQRGEPDAELVRLDGYELAARLSYLAWGSAPDAVLRSAADRGLLSKRGERLRELQRLLSDSRGRAQARTYVTDWLYLTRLERLERDPGRYPEYSSALADAMQQETLAVAEHLLFEDQAPLVELFSTQQTFVTPELATLYGLEVRGDGARAYDLRDIPQRSGVLTHPGVLALSGLGETPSLVARGLYVLRNVLCLEMDDPPTGVNANPPISEPGKSQRTYSQERLSTPACAGCHAQFDPLGYAFETFDGIGRWSQRDPFGNALRDDGAFYDLDGEAPSFDDTAEFIELLSNSAAVAQCVVKKPLQYSLGRPLLTVDACTLRDILDEVEAGSGSYAEVLAAIVGHETFTLTRADHGSAQEAP